jgi:hypothetical protein
MAINNNIECFIPGYDKVLGVDLIFKGENVPFASVDNSDKTVTSTNRTVGAGFTLTKTSTSNSSNSVLSNPTPLLFTVNSTTAETINFTPLSLDLSQGFFDTSEEGFLILPIILTGAAGNSALTLAQRTVQFAVRTTDSKVYGAVAVGALTPTVTDARFTVILGDASNTGAMNLQNQQYRLRIPLEVINDGNGNPVNISTTKIIDNVGVSFALPVGAAFEYYKPELYATQEQYCPDTLRTPLKNLAKFSFSLESDLENVLNFKKEIAGQVPRARKDTGEISLEGLDLNIIAKCVGAIKRTGGKSKPTFKTGSITTQSVTGTDIDLATTAEDISVYVVDGNGQGRYYTVINGGNPVANQVSFVKGANNKLVFNPTDVNIGKTYTIKIVGKDTSRATFRIEKSKSITVSLQVTIGNSDSINSSTDYKIMDFVNFFAKVGGNAYTLDEAKLAETTLRLERSQYSYIDVDGTVF